MSIEKSTNKIGKRVRLIFETCLQLRDKELLIGIANYFYNNNSFIDNKISKYLYNSEEKKSNYPSNKELF